MRPVGADAVAGERLEVARVEAGRVAGVVDHRPAHAAAGVVRAQRDRVGAGDDPRLGPVQVVRAGLVADPVACPGSQNGPASSATTRQPARASRCASTDPPAPQPTMTRSTSSASSKRRMSRRSRWLVRVPSLGSSHADSLRSAHRLLIVPLRGRDRRPGCASRTSNGSRGRRRCSCSRADRPGRGSRSRSTPPGGSRTPCRRTGSTGSTRGPRAGRASRRRQVLDAPAAALPGRSRQRGERGAAAIRGVGVEVGQRVPPGLAVLGHVLVAPAVGLPSASRASIICGDRDPGLGRADPRAGRTARGAVPPRPA